MGAAVSVCVCIAVMCMFVYYMTLLWCEGKMGVKEVAFLRYKAQQCSVTQIIADLSDTVNRAAIAPLPREPYLL